MVLGRLKIGFKLPTCVHLIALANLLPSHYRRIFIMIPGVTLDRLLSVVYRNLGQSARVTVESNLFDVAHEHEQCHRDNARFGNYNHHSGFRRNDGQIYATFS